MVSDRKGDFLAASDYDNLLKLPLGTFDQAEYLVREFAAREMTVAEATAGRQADLEMLALLS